MKPSPGIILLWRFAASEAERAEHEFIEPEHFAQAMTRGEPLSDETMLRLGVADEAVRRATAAELGIVQDALTSLGLNAVALRRSLRARLGKGEHPHAQDEPTLSGALRAHWRFKLSLSAAISALFWTAYLLAQRHPLGVVRPAPSLAVDAWIPFLPGTIYLYESLWVLQAIAPWLMRDRHELGIYCRTLLVILIPALLVFILWPTASPRPECAESANALYRALVRVDLDLNAFPSLHAAFALYSTLGCRTVFARMRCRPVVMILIWVWTAGILAATLLTKQHTVLDVVAGALLGWAGHRLYLRKRPAWSASAAPPAANARTHPSGACAYARRA